MKKNYDKPYACVFALEDRSSLLAGSLQITSGGTTFTNGGSNDGSDGAKSYTFEEDDEEWMSFYDYYDNISKGIR